MPDNIVPESRIFRIGRECYVIYLGNERDDVRPFLRIGNTRDIPHEVHDAIATTVITDDHLGNPLLEILNVPDFLGRYLGDPDLVGTMKQFFKSFNLPTEELTDYRKYKDGERRHMVWFYSNGNIQLRYDDEIIFELSKRGKSDLHSAQLHEKAKKSFLRNPLRYIRQDFNAPGLLLFGESVFWFEHGEMLSLSARPDFSSQLMCSGIDPDFISALTFDLQKDQMDSYDAEIYIGLVKRTRKRRKQLQVITTKPDLQNKIKLLFPKRNDTPATLEVTDISENRKARFWDSIVSRRDNKWYTHRAGLPGIVFDGKIDNGIAIDTVANKLTLSTKKQRVDFFPPKGFPIVFNSCDVQEEQLFDKYGTLVFNASKEHMTAEEKAAATGMEKFLKQLRVDVSTGKKTVDNVLKQAASSLKDVLKCHDLSANGVSWFYFTNTQTVLNLTMQRLEANSPLGNIVSGVISTLRSLMGKIPKPSTYLPFFGDLYCGEQPALLWRISKRFFTSADMASAIAISEEIQSVSDTHEAQYKADLERLLRLIRSLNRGGQGRLTGEQIALLAKPEQKEEKKQPISASPAVKDAVSPSHSLLSSMGHSTGDAPKTFVQKNQKRSRGFFWIWSILAVFLAFCGLFVWDTSGKAPWPSFFTERIAVPWAKKDDVSVHAILPDFSKDSTETSSEGVPSDSEQDINRSTETVEYTQAELASTQENLDLPDVNVNLAPKTAEDVQEYLNVKGRIVITEVDIHLLANDIAVINGYKDLDYRIFAGANPNWIYPGSILNLPDGEGYTIQSGDTIWFLAAREVRMAAELGLIQYDEAMMTLKNTGITNEERKDSLDLLRLIADTNPAASLRNMAANALEAQQM